MTTAYLALQNVTAPSDTFKTWNDVRSTASGVSLLDSTGAATGWSLSYTAQPGVDASVGADAVGTGDASWVDEASIMQEVHGTNDQVNWVTGAVSGLDDAKTYRVGFCSSQPNNTRQIVVRVSGGTEHAFPQEELATDAAHVFEDLSPVSGVLELEFRSGVDNYSYLSAAFVEEVDSTDTTAPTFTSGPAVAATTESGHTVSSTLDEAGTKYGVRLVSGATAPSSAQVKAGQDSTGSLAPESDSVAASAGVSCDLVFSTGSASTAYDYYIVAEDDETTPNIQTSPTLVSATTAAAPVPGLPSYTLNKDGTAVGDLTGVKIRVTATGELDGTELYSVNNATTTAGALSAIDLSATSASVGDTVSVVILTGANEGISFTDTVEDVG